MADEPATKRPRTAASSASSGAVFFQKCYYCQREIFPEELHLLQTPSLTKHFHLDCVRPYFQEWDEINEERNEERRAVRRIAEEAWNIAESRGDRDDSDEASQGTPPTSPQTRPMRAAFHIAQTQYNIRNLEAARKQKGVDAAGA